jgi:hypothetical protein
MNRKASLNFFCADNYLAAAESTAAAAESTAAAAESTTAAAESTATAAESTAVVSAVLPPQAAREIMLATNKNDNTFFISLDFFKVSATKVIPFLISANIFLIFF